MLCCGPEYRERRSWLAPEHNEAFLRALEALPLVHLVVPELG